MTFKLDGQPRAAPAGEPAAAAAAVAPHAFASPAAKLKVKLHFPHV